LKGLLNSGPPEFTSEIKQLEISQTTDYSFPLISDPDNDDYTVDVNLGEAFIFAKCSALKLKFNPGHDDFRQTPYLIVITLTDKNT
jgi:hypothetical protein